MGFWPFKRNGADGEVAFATRVVTALTVDGVKLRGKLTIHFTEPVPREEADAVADTCAFQASQLLSEAADHRRLLGAEEAIVAKLRKRLPEDLPELRSIELVSLHVIGDMAARVARRLSLRGLRPVDPKREPLAPPLMRRPIEQGLARRQLRTNAARSPTPREADAAPPPPAARKP